MEGHQYLQTTADPFIVEDLLDFPNDDVADTALDDSIPANSLSTDSSSLTALDTSISSSFSASCDPNFLHADIGSRTFSAGLCLPVDPYDDMAELEWLSNVVEESFSREDLQKLELISGMKARSNMAASETTHEFQAETNRNVNSPIFNSQVSVPAKARSKRSRGSPCNWTSRLLLLSSSPSPSPSPTSSSSDPDLILPPAKKPARSGPRRKDAADATAAEGRKCLHCATDKTPQWRTGPMGPKTLCNACGVRYKSGRLVPEYRPAASPTFVLTKHSNSHRKVMELRRQKEMLMGQQQQFVQPPSTMFDLSNADDFLIHQHMGPDFRHLF